MHEFALADAVVAAALRAARDAGMTRVERIVVSVGELQQIELDLFEFSLTDVIPRAEPMLAGARFDVRREPVRFGCRACGREYGRADTTSGDEAAAEAIHFIPELSHAYVRCPQCASPDFDILAGRGVTLQRIEGSDDAPAGGEGG
jgi:hydrogenase nickel incorporation protein HypA/HybF